MTITVGLLLPTLETLHPDDEVEVEINGQLYPISHWAYDPEVGLFTLTPEEVTHE